MLACSSQRVAVASPERLAQSRLGMVQTIFETTVFDILVHGALWNPLNPK